MIFSMKILWLVKSRKSFILKLKFWVKIFNKNQIQEIEIENFHTDTKIVIDGFENYISIVIPPFAKGLFQLMPYFE